MNSWAAAVRRRLSADGGGVAIYTAFFGSLAIGAGALAVDVGRMTVLRSQMQDRADAGALAGAAQLDGRVGAQGRATAVAVDAMSQVSAIAADAPALGVEEVRFYSAFTPTPVAATGDEDSKFIEVVLAPKRLDYLMAPVFDHFSGPRQGTLQASAVAGSKPFICHAPPLMICDPAESDPALDLALPANAGRQIQLKPPQSGGGAWAPGNYGLLALPDGSIGASDIEDALAAVEPADCYTLDVSTAPGVKTNKVQNGINARFDIPGGLPHPAPNVINYPKDPAIAASASAVFGDGDWDLDGYWNDKHGGAPPTELAGASRYQVYLYEQGLSFARNGRQTIYPVTGELPAGFGMIAPGGPDIPENPTLPDDPDHDGVPSQPVAGNGFARRLVQVAILQCVANNVQGHHTYPTNGRYVEMFLTEAVDEEPAGGIYGEVVRELTTLNDPDFHASARLVR